MLYVFDILSLFVHGRGLAPDKDDEVGERYCFASLAHILARLGFEIYSRRTCNLKSTFVFVYILYLKYIGIFEIYWNIWNILIYSMRNCHSKSTFGFKIYVHWLRRGFKEEVKSVLFFIPLITSLINGVIGAFDLLQ